MPKEKFLTELRHGNLIPIPYDVTQALDLKPGDLVEVEIQKVHADKDVKTKLFHDK